MFFSENLLNPQIDTNRKKNYKRNRKNSKNKEDESENENENELLIFGYACHIFRDDLNAERLEKENGDLLIPWHDDEKYSLFLDRYDVRNLIEDKITLEELENITNSPNIEESLYDEERYQDLDSEEEKLNEMSEDEREIYLEIKRERKKKEKEREKETDEDKNSDSSMDIEEPSTEKQRKIIEKTAKFITESSNPQIEIIIQAKQSSNPLFNFLNKNDVLYPYYERICLLMKMGLYTYSKEETNNSKINNNNSGNKIKDSIKDDKIKEDKGKNSKEKNEEEKNFEDLEKNIPENIKLIIEKMANYIARNGTEFETLVRQKNIGDERFSFMQPWNEYHSYYKYKINKSLNKSFTTEQNNNSNNISPNNNDDKNNNDINEDNAVTDNLKTKVNKSISIYKDNNHISNEPKQLKEENNDMKVLKAKRLKKMKEIIAKKKLKKDL